MPQDLIIWVVVLWFVLFLVLGQHVATVLFASGLLGIALWVGPQVIGGIIGTNVFFTASTYSLSIIPLYLLMAQMLLRGGVIADLFRVGYRLAGHRRSRLQDRGRDRHHRPRQGPDHSERPQHLAAGPGVDGR